MRAALGELKKALATRGLYPEGTKEELLERLLDHERSRQPNGGARSDVGSSATLPVIVLVLPATPFCSWAIATAQCIDRSVVDTHIGDIRRSMGSADFLFLPVVFPFFAVGAVVRCGVNWGEGRGHDDDLDLVAGSQSLRFETPATA